MPTRSSTARLEQRREELNKLQTTSRAFKEARSVIPRGTGRDKLWYKSGQYWGKAYTIGLILKYEDNVQEHIVEPSESTASGSSVQQAFRQPLDITGYETDPRPVSEQRSDPRVPQKDKHMMYYLQKHGENLEADPPIYGLPHCHQKRYQSGPVDGVEHALLIWMHLETQVTMLWL
ncbi:hypothetical protein WJX82_004916 [Trebouxia sp. C0006]